MVKMTKFFCFPRKLLKFITFFGIMSLILEHFIDGLSVIAMMFFLKSDLFDDPFISILFIGTTIIRIAGIYFAINIFNGRTFFINMFTLIEIAGFILIASIFLFLLSISGPSLEREILFNSSLKEILEEILIGFFFIMVLPAIWVQLPFVKNLIIKRYVPYGHIGG